MWKIQILLSSLPQSQAGKTAGADGVEALHNLIPLGGGAGKRVPPGIDPGGSVREKSQQYHGKR